MIKKKLPYIAAGLLIMIFVINGCGGTKPSDPKDPTLSLVFGYIDMEDAPSSMGWLTIKQHKPKPQMVYGCAIDDGLFWNTGVRIGSHRVEGFGKIHGFLGRKNYYYAAIPETQIRIKRPGLYFMGAYKFKVVKKSNWFTGGGGKFKLVRVKSPSERKLLKKLLKEFKDDDEKKFYRQIRMINKRLGKLR